MIIYIRKSESRELWRLLCAVEREKGTRTRKRFASRALKTSMCSGEREGNKNEEEVRVESSEDIHVQWREKGTRTRKRFASRALKTSMCSGERREQKRGRGSGRELWRHPYAVEREGNKNEEEARVESSEDIHMQWREKGTRTRKRFASRALKTSMCSGERREQKRGRGSRRELWRHPYAVEREKGTRTRKRFASRALKTSMCSGERREQERGRGSRRELWRHPCAVEREGNKNEEEARVESSEDIHVQWREKGTRTRKRFASRALKTSMCSGERREQERGRGSRRELWRHPCAVEREGNKNEEEVRVESSEDFHVQWREKGTKTRKRLGSRALKTSMCSGERKEQKRGRGSRRELWRHPCAVEREGNKNEEEARVESSEDIHMQWREKGTRTRKRLASRALKTSICSGERREQERGRGSRRELLRHPYAVEREGNKNEEEARVESS